MKFKYLLVSLVLVLSLHSCGGDDDVVKMDDNDLPPNFASVLVCPNNNNFQFVRNDNSLQISWSPCTSSNSTEVTYRIIVKANFLGCQIPAWPIVEDYYIPETFINIDNLGYKAGYKVIVEARDVNANYELLGLEEFNLFESEVFEGSLGLAHQGDVNIFTDHELTTINGDLIIEGNCAWDGNGPSISSLAPLLGIENITGDLIIHNAVHNFTSLDGLQSLTNVSGDIFIDANLESLEPLRNFEPQGDISLSGIISSPINMWNERTTPIQNLKIEGLSAPSINMLNNVASAGLVDVSYTNSNSLNTLNAATQIGSVNFYYNNNLTKINSFSEVVNMGDFRLSIANSLIELNGLSDLETVGDVIIIGAPLNNLDFLQNITSIDGEVFLGGISQITQLDFSQVTSTNLDRITFNGLTNLTTIIGLNFVETANRVQFQNNPQLSNLNTLNSIREVESLTVDNNDDLTNLDNFSNLEFLDCPGRITITGNFNLGDLCGLQDFFANNGLCSNDAIIENNGYNPTPLQIANGDCML